MKRLYLIELFSGSRSVSRALKKCLHSMELHVLSVDNDEKTNPTKVVDINKWNYKHDIDHFLKRSRDTDIIAVHASPPCTAFSIANTTGVRDIKSGTQNVKKAFEIIKYVRPDIWTLENPVGLLKDQPFMKKFDKYMNVTSYCKWGKLYQKPTNIWSNIRELNFPMCTSESPCQMRKQYGKHIYTSQKGNTRNGAFGSGKSKKCIHVT